MIRKALLTSLTSLITFFLGIRILNLMDIPLYVFYNKWTFNFIVFTSKIDKYVLSALIILFVGLWFLGFVEPSKKMILPTIIGVMLILCSYEIVSLILWLASATSPPNVLELQSYYWFWADAQIFGAFSVLVPYLMVGLLVLLVLNLNERIRRVIVNNVSIVAPNPWRPKSDLSKIWVTLTFFALFLASLGLAALPYMNLINLRPIVSVDGNYYILVINELANHPDVLWYLRTHLVSVFPILCYGLMRLGIDMVSTIRFMIGVLIFLTGLGMFCLLRSLRSSNFVAIIGMMLGVFGPITSTMMFSGEYEGWLAIMVMIFTLGFVIRTEKIGRMLIVALMGMSLTVMIHPLLGMVEAVVCFGYWIMMKKMKVMVVSVGVIGLGLVGLFGAGFSGVFDVLRRSGEMVDFSGVNLLERLGELAVYWVQGRFADWWMVAAAVFGVVVMMICRERLGEDERRMVVMSVMLMIVSMIGVVAVRRLIADRMLPVMMIATMMMMMTMVMKATMKVMRVRGGEEGRLSANALSRLCLLILLILILLIEANATIRLVMLGSQGLGYRL